jgi:hypothetical protein
VLELVIILKALTEIAGFALLGQGILYVLAGRNRDRNFPYLVLKTVTSPIFAAARFLAPRFFLNEFIWLLTPLLVLLLWGVFTYLKITLVLQGA